MPHKKVVISGWKYSIWAWNQDHPIGFAWLVIGSGSVVALCLLKLLEMFDK